MFSTPWDLECRTPDFELPPLAPVLYCHTCGREVVRGHCPPSHDGGVILMQHYFTYETYWDA